MNSDVDFINLKAYEFHAPGWEKDMANHHAPLRKKTSDSTDRNVNDAVNYWVQKGFKPNKIVLGIPLFGRSWTLSSNNTKPPANAAGEGAPGRVTKEAGRMAYYEICDVVLNAGWKVVRDPSEGTGPYAFSPTSPINWVGYDDPDMAVVKTKYILSNGLGGAMVWDMSYDDFRGSCGSGTNPVITAISNTLKGLPSSTNKTMETEAGFCECICE